jgi:PAS domain S-box-containing protein
MCNAGSAMTVNGALVPNVDFAQLVAVSGDAIVVADAHGIITYWNAAAERIFGFAAAEAIGQSLDLITPDRHRRRHWDGYHKTMQSGHTKYGHDVLRVPAMTKDGHALSIAFTVALLRDADDTVTAIVAIVRDETKRWTEDREIRRRLAELEANAATAPAQAST